MKPLRAENDVDDYRGSWANDLAVLAAIAVIVILASLLLDGLDALVAA